MFGEIYLAVVCSTAFLFSR